MKKKLLGFITAGCLLLSISAKAQESTRKAPGMDEHLKHVKGKLTEDLQLNKEQAEKVEHIFKDFFTAAPPPPPPPPPPPGGKEAFEKAKKIRDEQLKLVLTPEQFNKFMELEKKRRAEKPEGDFPPPPPSNN